ncbi:Glycerol kinase [Fulvia fulva]|nr:Glycerol kinase [Fulvia fulva]WPV30467.1 Glycerol kinase [Fulvia fulva]
MITWVELRCGQFLRPWGSSWGLSHVPMRRQLFGAGAGHRRTWLPHKQRASALSTRTVWHAFPTLKSSVVRGISTTFHGDFPAEMASSEEVFVGSIDQGTTSSRFLIFDKAGEPVAVHQEEFSQIYPNPGWHEHDPDEIVQSVQNCIEGALEIFEKDGHSKESIKAIGITNQRETTVCWDNKTGEPLHNAIVWTDTRTAALARELKARPDSDKLTDVCGLPISTYPSVTKLLWLLKNSEKVKKAYDHGTLAFGTIDAWLIYKLNGGPDNNVFVSDPTNASRTMFMDIHTLKYSEKMLDFFSYEFDMRKVHMPEIVRSSDKQAFGQLTSGSLKGFPLAGCLGDQSAALVGQKGFEPGAAKNTYGTGCFLLYNVGEKPVISTHGLLATVAYNFDGKPVYALEGSIAVAGSGVKFLMHNLGFSHASHKITELAETVKDNGGLVFVTAFSGLFAPYWIDDAHGTMFGITHHTERGHIARATLEAVCFQTKAILDAMEKDSGHKLSELKVDGGMSNSALCMQTQADLVGIPIVRPKMRETTALGAAIAAGFAVDVWKNFDELKEVNTAGQTTFEPQMDEKSNKKMFRRWERAVRMCKGWLAEEEEDEGKSDEAKEIKDNISKESEDASKL